MRIPRVYATTIRVLASYLWLRLQRPLMSDAAYARRLHARHRVNARRIRDTIVAAGGLFIKVGQLISIMTNFLPPEFRGELEGLQDRLPPRPFEDVRRRIEFELKQPIESLFKEFDRSPIATASLAQVHAATLHDGRRVAVKAQHRDIDAVARQDLEVIRRILSVVQWFTGVQGLESYHPDIAKMIAEELNFAQEAENIRRIGANFAGDPMARVPVVVSELSTTRVLTTEFVEGTKVTDFEGLSARRFERRDVAARVVAAYCRMIFVDGVYHADPHPGNIFVAPDGAIAFVDFGAVGVLGPNMREGIPAFFEGIIRRDPRRITDAIRTMGFIARDPNSVAIAERAITYFQTKVFDQFNADDWGLGDLQVDMASRLETLADLRKLDVGFRQLTTTFRVPKDWVLLERTLLLLLGLCTELDPTWNPMTVIRPYLEDVVLGKDRDWGELLRGSLKDMARTAITLPDDLQKVTARINRGELEIRVPEIAHATRVMYAGVRQLIYAIFTTACGVIAYQAYDRGQFFLSRFLAAATLVAAASLIVSMRRTR
ncbi:MAG TPA: AarF/UbiB family protein [Gemmatimonadaceae bacterium]|nr:AarF/UbiB family protein [Gemmatimonadaceae bacterium]